MATFRPVQLRAFGRTNMTIMNDANAREKLQVRCLLKCGSECAPPSKKHVCLKTFFLDGILEAIAVEPCVAWASKGGQWTNTGPKLFGFVKKSRNK